MSTVQNYLFSNLATPRSVRSLSKLLPLIDDFAVVEAMVNLGVDYVRGIKLSASDYAQLKSKCPGVNKKDFDVLFNGLIRLLLHSLRIPATTIKTEMFRTELVRDHRLPQNVADLIVISVLGNDRADLQLELHTAGPHIPRADSIKWRVDISISSRYLARILEPVVVITLQTGHEEISFECSMSNFHKLRYAVATSLKELSDIEERSVLKT